MNKALVLWVFVIALAAVAFVFVINLNNEIRLSPFLGNCDPVLDTAYASAVHQLDVGDGEECESIKSDYKFLEDEARSEALLDCESRSEDFICEIVEVNFNSNSIGLDSSGIPSCLVKASVAVSGKGVGCE